MCKTCQFFNVCGGCKYDFASPTYRDTKQALLRDINITTDPIWIPVHSRRRADFAFAGGHFGLFERRSKNIVSIDNCPLLCDEINNIYCLDKNANIKWQSEDLNIKYPKYLKLPYVSLRIKDDIVYANDFFGRRFEINAENGKILGYTIVK